jgi:cytochrome P450
MPDLPPILAAVTAADPYPYYASLRQRWPFGWDPALGAWVAADAAAVRAVLADPRWRVRPKAEPVPAALVGSPAGEIFGRLVRMDDSPQHGRRKAALVAALGGLAADAGSAAREAARKLVAGGAGLNELSFLLPVVTVGTLLGLPEEELPKIAEQVGALVRCFAPGASSTDLAAGKAAAGELLARFGELADRPESRLAELAQRLPGERAGVVANAIGFLTQAYEATAGLIAGSALALMRRPELRPIGAGADLAAQVREAARHDPPVQNTRRFAGEAFRFLGEEVEEGQMVLVLLASASRDPAAGPRPDDFDPGRRPEGAAGWGHGAHACPGSQLAVTIAAAALAALLAAGALPAEPPPFSYRPSLNNRIPIFAGNAS